MSEHGYFGECECRTSGTWVGLEPNPCGHRFPFLMTLSRAHRSGSQSGVLLGERQEALVWNQNHTPVGQRFLFLMTLPEFIEAGTGDPGMPPRERWG